MKNTTFSIAEDTICIVCTKYFGMGFGTMCTTIMCDSEEMEELKEYLSIGGTDEETIATIINGLSLVGSNYRNEDDMITYYRLS